MSDVVRVIRANRTLYVPNNPESKDEFKTVRLVQTGLIALVHNDYKLPADSFTELGKINLDKKSNKKEN